MKPKFKTILFSLATLGTSLHLHADEVLVTNGDFATGGGASWGKAGEPDTTITFPASGGNPTGYGLMDNNGNGFGVLVANDGDIPLASLGLVAGNAYNFFQDMKRFSGTDFGKLKIEFRSGGDPMGDTGDIPRVPVGGGADWDTYTYRVLIPEGIDVIRIVSVAGIDSSIGFDNIGVDNSPVPYPPVPNGDFEDPDGSRWFPSLADMPTNVTYPSEGGNPGGFVQIDGTVAEGATEIVSNSNAALPLEALGLVAGMTYTFQVDMKIISGADIGKLKVEFVPTGTGPLTPEIIGDGSDWQTYSFEITVPSDSGGIFVHLVAGEDSVVAFDNVNILVPELPLFTADIKRGTVVGWEATDETYIYQPQRSDDDIDYENFGAAFTGTAVDSVFDADSFPFYRVDVTQIVTEEASLNGGFEVSGFACAESWECLSETGQNPVWIDTDARSGSASIRISVDNDGAAAANKSELQQNIVNAGGFIVAGESYDFSFWAKQISSGVSYVQMYRVVWLDDIGNEYGDLSFKDFTGGDGEWVKISEPGRVPPAGATSALIQIFGATGAVADVEALGEVLIDDVSLGRSTLEEVDTFEATQSPGIGICWESEDGVNYQVRKSVTDLGSFMDFGAPVAGDGGLQVVPDLITADEQFYEVVPVFP